LALVAKAAESGDIRKASEEKNAAKIKELESFVKTARHTVTKVRQRETMASYHLTAYRLPNN